MQHLAAGVEDHGAVTVRERWIGLATEGRALFEAGGAMRGKLDAFREALSEYATARETMRVLVDLDDAEISEHAERVRAELPDAPKPDDFARRCDLLTISRKGKDLARFLQAASERGDRRFLTYVPRTLRAVRDAAERSAQRDPRLSRVAEHLCTHDDGRAARPAEEHELHLLAGHDLVVGLYQHPAGFLTYKQPGMPGAEPSHLVAVCHVHMAESAIL